MLDLSAALTDTLAVLSTVASMRGSVRLLPRQSLHVWFQDPGVPAKHSEPFRSQPDSVTTHDNNVRPSAMRSNLEASNLIPAHKPSSQQRHDRHASIGRLNTAAQRLARAGRENATRKQPKRHLDTKRKPAFSRAPNPNHHKQ
jgi:hypothetical protein